MEITEVRIKLIDEPVERLKAFCSITFDNCFVIRDLKLIDGPAGPFVAMPSRKIMMRCPRCQGKNPLRASFCNQCGSPLYFFEPARDESGRSKLYADIAHPINAECRDKIQRAVLLAYEQELILAQQPGYVCRYDDFDESPFDGPHFRRQPDQRSDNRRQDSRRQDNRYQESNGVSRRVDSREESRPLSHLTRASKQRTPSSQDDEFGSGIY